MVLTPDADRIFASDQTANNLGHTDREAAGGLDRDDCHFPLIEE